MLEFYIKPTLFCPCSLAVEFKHPPLRPMLAIARLVQESTSVGRQWLAQELMLGHVSRLSSPELESPEVKKLALDLVRISELSD